MSQASARHDVAVIGGGLVGLACALALARRDLDVALLERSRTGAEASTAAAGLLQPFADVLPPGPMLSASLEALELWPGWLATVCAASHQEVEYSDWGSLFVAWNDEELDLVERTRVAAEAAGQPVERLGPDEIASLVPQLATQPQGGLRLTAERRVDNISATIATAAACRAAGVHVQENQAVDAVDLGPTSATLYCGTRQLRTDRVVLAAGAWSGRIDGLPSFPVVPRRGQIICYRGCAWPWGGCVRRGRRYALRRGADRLLVGSTVEDVGFDRSTTDEAVTGLELFAQGLFPELAARRPAEAWAGLRPGSPDDLPLIGRWRDTPLWLASGHFRAGILLAPWTARRLADWMEADQEAGENPFSPSRFGELGA